MKLKSLSISLATIAVLSGLLLTTAAAVTFPNLPSTPVKMNVADGTVSYFVITLSNVPAGYDVTNGEYPGWCLDRGHDMSRSVLLDVTLYSSLSPPAPLDTKPWNEINYILNNKQGTMDDVQMAIWHFMGWWSYGVLSPAAKAMVDAANAHSDFVPTNGQIVGVICLPADTEEQLALIEVTPRSPGFTPGFWKHNIEVRLGLTKGSYNAFEGGPLDGVKLTDQLMDDYLAEIDNGLTFTQALANLNLKGWNPLRTDTANAFNEAAGYGPY